MDGCHEDHKGTFSITTERKEKEMNLRRKKRIIIALVLMLALALGVSPMVYAGGGSGETPTEPVATLTGIDPPRGSLPMPINTWLIVHRMPLSNIPEYLMINGSLWGR